MASGSHRGEVGSNRRPLSASGSLSAMGAAGLRGDWGAAGKPCSGLRLGNFTDAPAVDAAIGVSIPRVRPSPRPAKGLESSAGRANGFLCVVRRASNAGFSRERISCSGRATGTESCSTPGANTWGVVWRISPNVTLTAPRASSGITLSKGTTRLRFSTFTGRIFDCNCAGRAASTACKGRVKASVPGWPPGAGADRVGTGMLVSVAAGSVGFWNNCRQRFPNLNLRL